MSLVWFCFGAKPVVLQPGAISLAFGLAASNMHGWLQFGHGAILHSLQCHQDARVTPPAATDVNNHVNAVGAKCLILGEERVWTAADSLKLPLQQSSHWSKQNMNHNGWLSHTHVNSVFVFAPNELICCAAINCSGSWHDSTQANHGAHGELQWIHDLHGAKVVADPASGLQSKDFLFKSGQEDLVLHGQTTRARMQGLCC